MKKLNINLTLFIVIILIYILGQFIVGTYDPNGKIFVFNAPADADFLYYGAIANSVFNHFPPENPAFAGVKLTQPFIQYYPLAVLAKIFNPYNGIRILNIIYLVLFGLLLKSLFPRRYGLSLVVLFAGSIFYAGINATGIDFISRGFTHVPFFLLLAIALFHKRLKLRLLAIFGAAFINGYLMLIVFPLFIFEFLLKKDKEALYLLISGMGGLGLAGLFISSEAVSRPFYFIFVESFRFDPVEMIKHSIPMAIFVFLYRDRKMVVLLILAVIFGSLIHYNPFFPVFMVYFVGAMSLAIGKTSADKADWLVYPIVIILFVGFITMSYEKFDPNRKSYYPRYDYTLAGSFKWIKQNTKVDDCFLAVTADETDIALLMQYRPVYLGVIGHVSHLGLPWEGRYEATMNTFGSHRASTEIDYIFYGPIEKKYFPGVSFNYPVVYNDEDVTIYAVSSLF